ncbi:MAG: DUF1848 domain-containing protein [bacterium]|nr:DUF1848 domain-containing protein [bacterium]
MKRIISASRRTDIPAFYGDWFMRRLKEGAAGYVNPYGGQKYITPLTPQTVHCFVFWSKNYIPFMSNLEKILKSGFNFYFNYTINGLPSLFEKHVPPKEQTIENLKELSAIYSPKHLTWRYDPILISTKTDYNYHRSNFESIAASLSGSVERCYTSFVHPYGKVTRNIEKLQRETGITANTPAIEEQRALAEDLAKTAGRYGITLHSCCNDELLSPTVKKAHCIDGPLIEELFGPAETALKRKPSRKNCGCTESIDIGVYDSCPHGCAYCYATVNKEAAASRLQHHDPSSTFLGYTAQQSANWIAEIKDKEETTTQEDTDQQMTLF